MHWEILIIPLIALGVWILGTLFKGDDDKTKKGVRRAGSSAGRPGGRRPVTDLDRFLEEARRRREAEERPKPVVVPPPPPVRAPIARPALREQPPPRRETMPSRVAPPVLRREEVPAAVPVARPVEAPVVAAALPSREEPPPAPTVARATRLSPVGQQVRSLLSNPQTAATAFVLREIFDRPLCQRRR